MVELVLVSHKETDNKLRWDTTLATTKFELYIPKWRVPKPTPGRIIVTIGSRAELVESNYQLPREYDNEDNSIPIHVVCTRVIDCGDDVHFAPKSVDKQSWQIGEPYIPKYLLCDEKCLEVVLIVDWDQSVEWIAPLPQ